MSIVFHPKFSQDSLGTIHFSVSSHSLCYAGFQFVRAEGFVFGHVADEGIMESCAGELLRYRCNIGAQDILVFADIKKKHWSADILFFSITPLLHCPLPATCDHCQCVLLPWPVRMPSQVTSVSSKR